MDTSAVEANVSSDSSPSAYPVLKRRPEKPEKRKALPLPASVGRKVDDIPVPATVGRAEEKVLTPIIFAPKTTAHCVSSTVPATFGSRVPVTSAPLRPAGRLGSATRKKPNPATAKTGGLKIAVSKAPRPGPSILKATQSTASDVFRSAVNPDLSQCWDSSRLFIQPRTAHQPLSGHRPISTPAALGAPLVEIYFLPGSFSIDAALVSFHAHLLVLQPL